MKTENTKSEILYGSLNLKENYLRNMATLFLFLKKGNITFLNKLITFVVEQM